MRGLTLNLATNSQGVATSALIHDHPVERLTARERTVLHGLVLGLTDRQIGSQIYVSTETVKTHVKHIYQKLGVGNRTKAVVKAIAIGLISLEEALEEGDVIPA